MNVELLADIIRARGHALMGPYHRDERDDTRYEVGSALVDLADDILRERHQLEGNA